MKHSIGVRRERGRVLPSCPSPLFPLGVGRGGSSCPRPSSYSLLYAGSWRSRRAKKSRQGAPNMQQEKKNRPDQQVASASFSSSSYCVRAAPPPASSSWILPSRLLYSPSFMIFPLPGVKIFLIFLEYKRKKEQPLLVDHRSKRAVFN